MIPLVLTIALTVLALLCGTAALAIQEASPTRLGAILKNRGREGALDRFFKHQEDYARTATAYQQIGITLFVLTVFISLELQGPWYIKPPVVVAICVPWHLLFGVGIPAAWARYAGDRYLAVILPLLELARRANRPLLAVVNLVDEVVRRLAGAPREAQNQSEQIEIEIMDAVSHGETAGAVDPAERAMIKSVMVLDETSVGEIMTPRTDVVGIDVGRSYEQTRALAVTDGHSRIPVYEESIDHIVGVLYVKDLLRADDAGSFSLRSMMRGVTFVPETKDLASLLREFQANRVHIAIVVDEYGGTAGLVTFEDILEELVGEITDEHDPEPAAPPIQRIDDKTADVDARVRVEELNEQLDLDLPEDDGYDTVGGYVFSKLGRIPSVGETLTVGGVRIVITEAQERSIGRLRVHIAEP
jgi:putative hemolysin